MYEILLVKLIEMIRNNDFKPIIKYNIKKISIQNIIFVWHQSNI
jgi:hypothetical protein